MSVSAHEREINDAKVSLARVQEFNSSDLIQKERLGQNSFEDAVAPASQILSLFRQLPQSALELLPSNELLTVKTLSDSAFQIFQEILDFDDNAGDNKNRQAQQIERLTRSYQSNLSQIFPLISYSIARTVDFNRLEEQGRAAVQSVRDQTDLLMADISRQQSEAARILDEVRKTAAERGVSQEAVYFKGEAENHAVSAKTWRNWTIIMSAVVGIYGAGTLFLHKIPYLSPNNTYETVQLMAGKLIMFFILVYMLSICAKNFLSNRHNEIVNRHRQNSLLTYRTLVDAGARPEARDVILNHAASSIYQLHDTGFTKSVDGGGTTSSSIIGLLPKAALPSGSSGA